ncbi:unnamed protein product [Sphenostylis stenocarpa]|uniref:Peptidase A1 domain-containing protein n=1 Tax=Sphenostylis stenocarpa TaxID=92480 RepID=A0AA86W545_9FABA|nr:unnamed protein product [Sphenostylis stenocarpa]
MSPSSSLIFFLLYLCNLSFLDALDGGFSVEIIHRDSPKSPFYRSTETHFQRVSNSLRRSINRVNHFNESFVSPNTPKAIVFSDFGEYVMRYAVGTPPVKVFGIIDTASDIIWMQCKPCKKCYRQATPFFDSRKSVTYKTIPCNSKTCDSVLGTACTSQFTKHCTYNIYYGDGTYSHGDLSEETLTLASTNGFPVKLPGTTIGCGRYNGMVFKGANSGIVGLARGPVSLVTQLGPSVGWKFSYCLVQAISKSNSTSKLNFGDAAMVYGPGTVSTPLFSHNKQLFYYLTLEGLSVGSNRIEFGSSLLTSGGGGNIIIDSGTTLTFLPEDVYSRLELAVAQDVKLKRTKDPNQVLGLCYEGTLDKLDLPVITAHFSGANVLLYAINTFVEVADGVVCLAFQPSQNNGAIFGNLAQQNLLIGYDLQKNTVSFKHTDCSKM